MFSENRTEILTSKNGHPLLARVLLQYDILKWKYPKNGVWSYILDSGSKVTIFDTGPYYNTLLGNKGKLTNNSERLLLTIDNVFKGKPISQIVLSHYHHDHSQNAAYLQKLNEQKHKILAPIRVHAKDMGNKKLLRFLNSGLNNIFVNAGFKDAYVGKPVKNGELLENTGFQVVHSPGHTHGSISLVNHTEKILITGWWLGKTPNFITDLTIRLINEDFNNILHTQQTLKFEGYKYFYLHELGNC